MKRIRIILITVLLCGMAGIVCAQTWQETLENAGFDIVETFDNLQDWYPITCPSCSVSNLPKKMDGTPSRWGRYCMWGGTTPDEPLIGNHGADKQVGTKSFSGIPSSYMTMYFGDGTPGSGYSDFYIFFRVYLPRNLFPTRVLEYLPDNKVLLDYVEGEKYIWWDSFKFINLNTGFTSANGWNYLDPVPDVNRYGDTEIWYHLYRDSSTNSILSDLQTFFYKRHTWGNPEKIKLDKLIGMEFHFKLEEPAGYGPGYTGNGTAEMWAYDENGSGELILQATNMSFRPETGEGHIFNRIQISGNRHTGYYWVIGQGMTDEFYLDDFIIDDERIGLKYYALLNNQQARLEDINSDGKVNVLDVQLCVNIVLGIVEDLEKKADVNGDQEVNISDVQSVVNKVLGLGGDG